MRKVPSISGYDLLENSVMSDHSKDTTVRVFNDFLYINKTHWIFLYSVSTLSLLRILSHSLLFYDILLQRYGKLKVLKSIVFGEIL